MKKSNLFKRILAYTLVLSVIFSQLVFSFNVSAAEEISVWDGTKAESFAGGDGSAASPYLIETAEQLYKMVEEYHTQAASLGKYFKITKDIYINNPGTNKTFSGAKDWLAAYGDTIATASKANAFSGTLDGGSNTIYGLYVSGKKSAGLFPAISSYADIKNLAFDSVYITGGSGNAGALSGSAYWYDNNKTATITNCSVVNSTIGKGGNIGYVGGLVGHMLDCTITFTNCYAYGNSLSDWGTPGGIVGNAYASGKLYLVNCYSAGQYPVRATVSKAVCTNVYTDTVRPADNTTENITVLTTEQMMGEAAKTNMSAFDFDYEWKTVTDGYPVTNFNLSDIWDGTKSANYAGGTGTESDPYIIENAAQLYKMVAENSTTSATDEILAEPKYFKIVKDICLNKITDADLTEPTVTDLDAKGFNAWYKHYYKSQGFCGVVDGGGHTVYGLYCNGADYSGLINSVTDYGKISNLNLKNAFIYGKSGVGGIVGLATGSLSEVYVSGCMVDNVYLDNAAAVRLGGIVGGGDNSVKHVNISYCAVTRARFITTHATYKNIQSGIFGYTGEKIKGHVVTNCYTDDSVHPVTDTNTTSHFTKFTNFITYSNVYTVASNSNTATGVTTLTADQMKGDAAKENMSGLNFELIWQTVENDYPIIRKNPILDWWDGTKAESFAGGDGTETSPFLIENASQLYKMVEEYYTHTASLGKYFKITKDIYINNPGTNKTFSGAKDWLAAYGDTIATASKANAFSGTLDGGSNTIYGLYVSGKKSAGLFPAISSYADIKNLAFDSVYITGGSGNAGALSGSAYWYDNNKTATITNCSVVNSTIGKGGNIGYVGGLVGHMLDCTITFTNCYAYGNSLSDWGTPGGIVGNAYDSGKLYLVNCYSVGQYPVRATVNKAVCTNVYTDTVRPTDNTTENITVLETAKMQGAAAIDNLAGFNFNQIWQYGADGEYPTHKAEDVKAMYWNGTAATDFAGGNGELETPYQISNAEQLYLLANSDTASTSGKYYVLTNDINISDVHEGWENENPYSWTKKTAYLDGFSYSNSFAGTLDGAGYTVRGLYYTDEITNNGTYAYGLIPFVSANAVIKNINVEYAAGNVIGSAYTGAVAGAAHVTKEDIVIPLNMVQFVGVNVSNTDLAVLGGASRGVKFELCNAETLIGVESEKISVRNCNTTAKYNDDVLILNNENKDSTSLTYIINFILGDISKYITDINGDANFNLLDLVSIKIALATLPSDEYAMVWSQEFDGDAVDYSVLTTNTTMSVGSTLEYADNAAVSNGSLTLSCNDTGRTDANGNKIYSVNYGLSTIDTMSFKYGKLEMRAKVPFGAGAFPSLWLTSRNAIGYNQNSEFSTEIDIFEVFAKEGASDTLVTCIHKWYNDENGAKTGDECSCGSGVLATGNGYKVDESDRSYTISGASQNEYHTFVFEWDEDSMSFSVDGNVYYTALRSEMDDFDINGYETNSDGIFNQALCIRLNNHMYTTGDGAAYTYAGDAEEIDPSKLSYEIDYIRVYQKNDGKSEITFR